MRSAGLFLFFFILISVMPLRAPVQAQECTPSTFEGAFADEVTLCQNWSAQEQQEFWFTAQGSRILPYRWFLALEMANSTELFSNSFNLDGFRYLPQRETPLNPDGLPIGFTNDIVTDNDPYASISRHWLGMTCAACHTGQVEFNGTKMLIDGAPAMADFEGFMRALAEALQATIDDPGKFERFSERILGKPGEQAPDADTLKQQLTYIHEERHRWNELNEGDHKYGFARLDAIGAIMNSVGVTAQFPGDDSSRNSANAPVSYPFVWDTPQHDRVQWNASVANAGPGALGRNVGEVLGVFGHLKYNPIDLRPSACLPEDAGIINRVWSFFGNLWGGSDGIICFGHASSIKSQGLQKVEDLLWSLQSPQWPQEFLGEIDTVLAARGEEIFREAKCIGCHDGRHRENSEYPEAFRRDDPNRRIEAQAIPVSEVGTDATMATNFVDRIYPVAGDLKRQPKSFLHLKFPPRRKDFFGEEAAGHELVSYAVKGVIINKILNDPENTIAAIQVGQDEQARTFLEGIKNKLVEAKDSNNIERLRIILDAIEEADKRKLVDWVEGKIDDGKGRLRARLGEMFDRELDQLDEEQAETETEVQSARDRLMVYKARPLNGIWATGPYLHNGSVRTIRQLLLPAKCPDSGEFHPDTGERQCRQKTFHIGSRQYDQLSLGFADNGPFLLDTDLPGNSNKGHTFGHSLFRDDPAAIDALLEYLKTL